VRARNQQRAYVDRVAASRAGRPLAAADVAPVSPARSPASSGAVRAGWQVPGRSLETEPAARPA
jgi:RNA polymerase sigma factor for flagellar operon FliA